MPNKTRLEKQSSPEPINALNNNKHIKITYMTMTMTIVYSPNKDPSRGI